MRQHQVSVAIESDEFLVGPHERSLSDASFLPVDIAGFYVNRGQDWLAALASAGEVDRVGDAHGIAVVQTQAIGGPQFAGLGLKTVALKLDHLRSRVIFG